MVGSKVLDLMLVRCVGEYKVTWSALLLRRAAQTPKVFKVTGILVGIYLSDQFIVTIKLVKAVSLATED
jgi:hypothetical protein